MDTRRFTDAQREAIRRALRDVVQKGRVTPDDVVRAASRRSSPLHAWFEWDDEKAGHFYRIEQARDLIRWITVEIETSEKVVHVPAYVRDPLQDGREQGYVDVEVLKKRPEDAAAFLLSELERVESILRRAEAYVDALTSNDEMTIRPHLRRLQGSVQKLAARVRQGASSRASVQVRQT